MKSREMLYSELSPKERLKEAWREGMLFRFYSWLKTKKGEKECKK
jgi:hypothetical protein